MKDKRGVFIRKTSGKFLSSDYTTSTFLTDYESNLETIRSVLLELKYEDRIIKYISGIGKRNPKKKYPLVVAMFKYPDRMGEGLVFHGA